jgi:hypothetical protein
LLLPPVAVTTDASVVIVVFYRVLMEESVQKPWIPRVVEDAFGGQFWLFSSNQDDGSERQYLLLYTRVSNVPSKMNGFVFFARSQANGESSVVAKERQQQLRTGPNMVCVCVCTPILIRSNRLCA